MADEEEACLSHKLAALRREQDLLWIAHSREHQLLMRELDLAATQLAHRLEGMNLLREQINSERGRFLLRDSYDTQHEDLKQRITTSETLISNFQGRFWMLATIPSVLVILIDVTMRLMAVPH